MNLSQGFEHKLTIWNLVHDILDRIQIHRCLHMDFDASWRNDLWLEVPPQWYPLVGDFIPESFNVAVRGGQKRKSSGHEKSTSFRPSRACDT